MKRNKHENFRPKKKGINQNEGDKNYDLFKKAIITSSKYVNSDNLFERIYLHGTERIKTVN